MAPVAPIKAPLDAPLVPETPKLVCKPVAAGKPLQQFCSRDMAFKCQECNQSFETEHALNLHVKYIHRSKED
ncbi:unnamed protein product [Cladocopium goreaui]|uniref:C2H2-type domain-containing protein n=1 Tax=Cladocopium goreaui TaxID=2562237 RepID=A0A9P1C2R0_9DINO|nr:unnamed protein product [Cladocopium goreaui]